MDFVGGNAATIAAVTGFAAGVLALTPAAPLGVALAAVSSAASAYAAGQEAAQGDTVGAALDGLGSVLGGTAAAEHLISALDSWAAKAGGAGASALKDSAAAEKSLAETLDKTGYPGLAASILRSLEAQGACG